MSDQDYGFTRQEARAPIEGDSSCTSPDEHLSSREQQRRQALASWWLQQLNLYLKRYMMNPTEDRKGMLNHLMSDYAKHVAEGAVRPPRFSLD
jgi:hypothetical protein